MSVKEIEEAEEQDHQAVLDETVAIIASPDVQISTAVVAEPTRESRLSHLSGNGRDLNVLACPESGGHIHARR